MITNKLNLSQVTEISLARQTFTEGSSPWKVFVNHLLIEFNRIFLFKCNYDIKEYNINSIFYKELGGGQILE